MCAKMTHGNTILVQPCRQNPDRKTWDKSDTSTIILPKEEDTSNNNNNNNSNTTPTTDDVLEWIRDIPLTKAVKNLPRDFSDAVLMSEIIKFYYPHLVISHYYIPGNSIKNKRENWNTLNRRVLDKINMHLSNDTIDLLVHSKNGAIEKLLSDFRERQTAVEAAIKEADSLGPPSDHSESSEKNSGVEGELSNPRINPRRRKKKDESKEEKKDETPEVVEQRRFFVFRFIIFVFRVLFAIICFWRWFSSSTPEPPKEEAEEESDEPSDAEEAEGPPLRENYTRAMEKLRTKTDVIKTLCHKVAYLEGSIKLKDQKISNLLTHLQEVQSHSHMPDSNGLPPRLTMHTTCSLAKQRRSLDKPMMKSIGV